MQVTSKTLRSLRPREPATLITNSTMLPLSLQDKPLTFQHEIRHLPAKDRKHRLHNAGTSTEAVRCCLLVNVSRSFRSLSELITEGQKP